MNSYYRLAQALVSTARIVSATFYAALAILLIAFALWLAFPLGQGWLFDGLALLLGWSGAATGVKAAERFLSTRPAERPDERERYLQSRSLYNPGSRRESGRRERES
jgi:fatty acid desaturase